MLLRTGRLPSRLLGTGFLVSLLWAVVSPDCLHAQARVRAACARGAWGFGAVAGAGAAYGQNAAAMMESAVQLEQARSEAVINAAQAQSQYIENVEEWNAFYNDRRDAYKARREVESERERAKTQKYVAERKSKKPPRLTSAELDPYTGAIHWPDALLRPDFEARRKELEGLFVSRAHTGSTPAVAAANRTTARAMQADLRAKISEYNTNPNEYLVARRFLESLAEEGQFALE